MSTLADLRRRNVEQQRAAKATEEAAIADAVETTPEPATHITGNTVIRSVRTPADRLTDVSPDVSGDTSVSLYTDKPAGVRTDVLTDTSGDTSVSAPIRTPADLSTIPRALALLAERSATPYMAITLKVPGGLNEYVDEYVRERWRDKIKKQDVIARALQLAIYELETGKELVKLDAPKR